ncbi:MAG: hypothetical protein J3Q66DRAFT_359773 [Benniella sp.]|nr:MAG: hypothetical protein J3Q66DRAFT_359773 [Benniella sp.]
MRFTQYSLPLAIVLSAQALPQVLAAETNATWSVGEANVAVIENQRLYISGGLQYDPLPRHDPSPRFARQFISLDLSTAWTSDAPAFTNHTFDLIPQEFSSEAMVLTKDRSSLLFFYDTLMYKYDVKANEWAKDLVKNWTYPAFAEGAVTDTDTGLIYGIQDPNEEPPADPAAPIKWKFTEYDPTTDTINSAEFEGVIELRDQRIMVYSKAAKSIFSYENAYQPEDVAFVAYDVKAKKWSAVKATGDIPPFRRTPCFASAYGGKKLILAGGMSLDGTAIMDDVFMFDVATLAWSKLANAPRASYGAVCAASSDSFIYWGGFRFVGNESDIVNIDEGPAILNLASNTWGTSYKPSDKPQDPANVDSGSGPGSGSGSSVNRAYMALTKFELVAWSVMAIVASSLTL